MPQLPKAAPTIDVDGLKEANSIRPAHYVRSFYIEHQANSGSYGPSNWKAVEEFCGFNRENLEEFQRAAKEQTGEDVDLWVLIAGCTMLHMAST